MTDEKVKSDGLKTIFGKSSMSAFTNSSQTPVNYHNKNPSFQDEIKIMLPFGLKDQVS